MLQSGNPWKIHGLHRWGLFTEKQNSLCVFSSGLLHLRYWHLLENAVQGCSGLKNKEKESEDLILPVSLWKMVDYAMPASFYCTTEQPQPQFNKAVHYKMCAQAKAALSNSSFKIWATRFNWGWGESLSNTNYQILYVNWCVISDQLLFCHHFSGHVCPPSLFLSFSFFFSFTDLELCIICLGKIPWVCNSSRFCPLREEEN